MSQGPLLSAEELIVHEASLRALVRRLVLDDHEVDDVVQRTWVAALERPPAESGALAAWLRQVAVNFARMGERERGRRQTRERRAALPEGLSATDDIVDRLQRQRQVVDTVLALADPYRSVVLLRFFEDLPPRRIARRLDVPLETVKSQLKRALQMMRKSFDARHGDDRRAWCLFLLPLAVSSKSTALLTTGVDS